MKGGRDGWTERGERESRKDDSKTTGGEGCREEERDPPLEQQKHQVKLPATVPWHRSANCREADRCTCRSIFHCIILLEPREIPCSTDGRRRGAYLSGNILTCPVSAGG